LRVEEVDLLALWSFRSLRNIIQLSISVAIGKFLCLSRTRREGSVRRVGQVIDLPSDIFFRVVASETESTVACGYGSATREVQGLQVAQQVQGGDDQGGPVGVTTGLAGATTGVDNSDAGEAGSMAGSWSLAATR
jgi:hypothetical protein